MHTSNSLRYVKEAAPKIVDRFTSGPPIPDEEAQTKVCATRGGSLAKWGLAGAVDDFQRSYRVNFPSGGSPVSGTVWGGVDGLRFVLDVK